MYERFWRDRLRQACGLVAAAVLAVVPAVLPVFGQEAVAQGQALPVQTAPPPAATPHAVAVPEAVPTPRPVPGIAIGDCGDLAQAMVRSYGSATRRPANPSMKSCEGGRIQVRVGTERHFGYRIMDLVRVTVLLKIDPGTRIDFESLRRGNLTFNGQEFDLVAPLALPSGQSPVDVEARQLRDGSTLLRIELLVQSSVPASVAPYLVFRLDLRYAVGNIRDADGRETASPDWRVLSTAPIALTMSSTAVAADQFRDIALESVPQVLPWPTLWLLILGVFSILFMPGLLAVRWINRNRPGRIQSREEIAWRAIDEVYASARRNDRFSKTHVRRIAYAVRTYFGVQAATLSEVRSRLKADPRLSDIVDVLRACEGVLFESGAVDDQDMMALRPKLESIIPRP